MSSPTHINIPLENAQKFRQIERKLWPQKPLISAPAAQLGLGLVARLAVLVVGRRGLGVDARAGGEAIEAELLGEDLARELGVLEELGEADVEHEAVGVGKVG